MSVNGDNNDGYDEEPIENGAGDMLAGGGAPFEIAPGALESVIAGAVRAALASIRLHDQQARKIPLADISSQIPPFTGCNENIEMWLRKIDIVQETHNLEDSTVFVVATNKLQKRARDWYESQVELTATPWPDLKEKLRTAFKTTIDKISLFDTMRLRKWTRSESIEDYYYDKLHMLNILNTPLEDTILHIIRGIDNTIVRIQLKSRTFESVEELLLAMKSLAEELPTASTIPKKTEKTGARVATRTNDPVAKETKSVRCFNCHQFGHYKSECQNAKAAETCFKCNQAGHLSRHCPQTIKRDPKPPNGNVNVAHQVKQHLSSIDVTINGRKFSALVDSGSSANLVREDIAEQLRLPITEDKQSFTGLGLSSIRSLGRTKIPFQMNNEHYELDFSVVPCNSIMQFIILGEPLLDVATVTLTRDGITVKKNAQPLEEGSELFRSEIYQIQAEPDPFPATVNPVIEPCVKAKLTQLITEYEGKVKQSKPTVEMQATITLTDEKEIYHRPRRLSPEEEGQVREIVDNLMKEGIIRPSKSNYCSPIVLVRKKSGEIRMCQDYRRLNAVTVKEHYPLPLIEDNIDKLGNKIFYTLLDLRNGFHQIPMSPESIKYTSFVTPFGQFEYVKMPFGLTNAPRIFQRFVNFVLLELIRSGAVVVYLDDCLIATTTIEQNLEILETVLNLFAEFGLMLRLSKCYFFMTSIQYLGYEISASGIKPGDEKIEAVSKFPQPQNVHDIRSFLGLASYFRRFVKDFSRKAKPLSDLTRRSIPFVFGEDQVRAFEQLKNELTSKPILAIFNLKFKTELHTDASSYGYAAILMQQQEDKNFHPVCYYSAKTSCAESKYHSFELETLAVVKAVSKFRIYLHGIEFVIITDCNALKQTLNKREICPKINRWALQLQEFRYRIEHRKANFMTHVDALSRHPVMIVENDLVKNLQYTQYTDSEIKTIIDNVNKGDKKLCGEYSVNNGLLFRKGEINQLVVPLKMRRSVVVEYHDNNAHVGVEKVLNSIKQYYWFRNMKKYVTQHIKHCLVCIQFNSKARKEGKLHMPDKGEVPFNLMHVDHFSLSRTSRGNSHVFLIVDAFTKFLFLRAVKKLDTNSVLKYFKEIFAIFGNPKIITSDRGTAFTSREFQAFCDARNIKHIKIAVSSPESNGQVERYVRTVKNALIKCSNSEQWDEQIEFVQTTINNTYQKSIACTPSKLFFGFEQDYLSDQEIRNLVKSVNDCEPVTFEQLRLKASNRIKLFQKYNKSRADLKRSDPFQYQINDLVCLQRPRVVTRGDAIFAPKFQGPYVITKILENDRYVVEDVPGLQHTQRFYSGVCAPSNMKMWCPDTDCIEPALVEDD